MNEWYYHVKPQDNKFVELVFIDSYNKERGSAKAYYDGAWYFENGLKIEFDRVIKWRYW